MFEPRPTYPQSIRKGMPMGSTEAAHTQLSSASVDLSILGADPTDYFITHIDDTALQFIKVSASTNGIPTGTLSIELLQVLDRAETLLTERYDVQQFSTDAVTLRPIRPWRDGAVFARVRGTAQSVMLYVTVGRLSKQIR